MTIKGLQKLIGKDAYNLTLLNQYAGSQIVRQHLSVWGRAIYPMDGLPVMDEETLLAVLDVPRERWKNCHVLTAWLNTLRRPEPVLCGNVEVIPFERG